MHATLTTLSLAVLLSSCGGAEVLLQSKDGKYRVVYIGEGKWLEAEGRQQMEAALARCPAIDLVYAHNDPMAHGAALAARQQQRAGIAFVGVDGLAHEGRRYVQDGLLAVTIEYPTCAAAALDLAVLACRNVQLPPELVVGTRVFTQQCPDGRPIASAGDVMLTSLRSQYKAALSAVGALKIGMAQCNDAEPWREAMREDMKAWAAQHPFVQFDYRDAANDTQKQRDIVIDFTVQQYDAIVVSPKESLALAQVCKDAMARGIKIIVLDRRLGSDDFTCFVGGDNTAIGKAAGEQIKALLPDGGTIVEIQGLMTSSPAQERHQGFVEALGLAPRRD
jgi:ABC-type sugar transport system substrate-binding protein